jgi:hypothetical protein
MPTGPLTNPTHGSTGSGDVTSIALRPDGAFGWIAYDYGLSHYEVRSRQWVYPYFVYAHDRRGKRVLGSGTTTKVHPGPMLTLRGRMLYWTQNGKPMSARLG